MGNAQSSRVRGRYDPATGALHLEDADRSIDNAGSYTATVSDPAALSGRFASFSGLYETTFELGR